ncbi:hypothetical protein SS50377_21260 [Spironucleus salmonicida]|uniref:Uncharacterized protein n=1 Tax=Spironucleus salmonicida TaxID=348837 RepID=V6LJX7_9EUKA|nr:hypothetical protein SS50377_21260 [Spironucleus salmonicida]|eukprot:EST44031.1 Hypothetical protein SS50377_16340 [Spironucleus salmonicida]
MITPQNAQTVFAQISDQDVKENVDKYIQLFITFSSFTSIGREAAIQATGFYRMKLQHHIMDQRQKQDCFIIQQSILSQFNLSNVNKGFKDIKINEFSPQQIAQLASFYSQDGLVIQRLQNAQIALIFDKETSINVVFPVLIFCGRLDLIESCTQYLNKFNEQIFQYIQQGDYISIENLINSQKHIFGSINQLFFISRAILLAELKENQNNAKQRASAILIESDVYDLNKGVSIEQIDYSQILSIGDENTKKKISEMQ